MQCECGDDVFEPDDDGLYYEDEEEYCAACGRMNRVCVTDDYSDDATASVSTSDDDIIDVGQPRCDGSACGACASFLAEMTRPCTLDCSRVTDVQRSDALRVIGGPR